MLVTELPETAVLVAPGEWNDATTQTRYYVDPHDATLVAARDWTPAEIASANQQNATRQTNARTLNSRLATLVSTLRADVGPASAPPGVDSLNAIINDTSAQPIARVLARFLKRTDMAVLALAKLELGQLDDTDTGA